MKRHSVKIIIVSLLGLFLIGGVFVIFFQGGERVRNFFFEGAERKKEGIPGTRYPSHEDITTTVFWVGESASKDNKEISNSPSAWDDEWEKHFGGVDSPERRNGWHPAGFVPRENPFYFALPYNDFDEKGKRKKEAEKIIPWAEEKPYGKKESMCKNRWVKITKGSRTAYAQWEDVGPFNEDDKNYVFGSGKPKSKTNKNAGLDVSPAVRDYLDLKDVDKASWQFIDDRDVPDGPWREIVTVSQVSWN